jgi:predicted dehydrogenase
MKVGILGSGFGLYGYLPAILACGGESIFLPERYRATLCNREDVGHLTGRVHWCADEQELLGSVEAVIIAKRPADQVTLVAACCARENIERVLLEKPIAPNPQAADTLLEDLLRAGKRVRIAYTFRYTGWGQHLLRARHAGELDGPVRLAWHFRAHHRKTGAPTWKRQVSEGGGALRFFGIHLIALLSELGYTDLLTSTVRSEYADEADLWQAVFTGTGLPAFEIDLDANASPAAFRVCYAGKAISLSDPFEAEASGGKFDRRVTGLAELCSSFLQDEPASLSWYRASLRLWSRAEEATLRVSESL